MLSSEIWFEWYKECGERAGLRAVIRSKFGAGEGGTERGEEGERGGCGGRGGGRERAYP